MSKYISSFDYLRAFFSILVVVWHTNALFFITINPKLQDIVNIFYYNICLLAVPVFFSISLFLFYRKQSINQSKLFPSNRLINLLSLYAIWMCIGIAINSLTSNGEYLLQFAQSTRFFLMLVTGSRGELWFLFSLPFITFLSFLNSKYLLGRKNAFWIQLILLFGSLLILVFFSFATLITHRGIYSAYWNPICFTPYIFSSSILFLINEDSRSGLTTFLHRKRFIVILILSSFFIFSSWLEWQYFNFQEIFGGYLLPPYARVSLVIGAFLMCYCASLYKSNPPDWVRNLSQESLGIYLLHSYVLLFIGYILSLISKLTSFQLILSIIFNPITIVVIAVTISVFSSKILKQYKVGRVMLNVHSK